MKKSQIMDLIESYHGEVNSASLIAQEPYQKGWVKRLFDTRTQGILDLETFLELEAVKPLAPDDEIEDDNLINLLEIIYTRDKRIYKTSRSYENYPEKCTNRVYSRLYHLLMLDAALQTEINVPFPHTEILHQTLFSRITKQVLVEKEQLADRIYRKEKKPQFANAGYLRLGLALIFKKTLFHRFDYKKKPSLEGLTFYIKTIHYHDQTLQVKFHFLKGELHDVSLLNATIQCRQDIRSGLRWLNKASYNGDCHASLHLAAYYARRENYYWVNRKTNPDRTIELLNLASEQGSKMATTILDKKLKFGGVSTSSGRCCSIR